MRHAIFADLAPRSVIEWLLAIDVVELSWEIQRYRILRHKLLEHFREKAIEQTLRHIDLAGLPSETEDHARYQIQRNARIWRIDPTPASEIETRLAAYGYDSFAINTQVVMWSAASRNVASFRPPGTVSGRRTRAASRCQPPDCIPQSPGGKAPI